MMLVLLFGFYIYNVSKSMIYYKHTAIGTPPQKVAWRVASARDLLIVIITGQDPEFLTRPAPKRILKASEFSSEFPTEKWYLEIQTKFRYASAPRVINRPN